MKNVQLKTVLTNLKGYTNLFVVGEFLIGIIKIGIIKILFVYLNEGKQQKKMHKIRKFSTDNFSLHQAREE